MTRSYILNHDVMRAACIDDLRATVDDDCVVICDRHGDVVLRIPVTRVAYQLAWQLCEAADRVRQPPACPDCGHEHRASACGKCGCKNTERR